MSEKIDEIDAVVQREMARWSIPGIAVGVLRGDKIETRTWGVVNLNWDVAMHPDALVRIASISKVFTATLAMILVDEGILDLDTPVIEYLPDLRLTDSRARQAITPRHLLSHGSGLHGDFFIDKGMDDDALARYVAEYHTLRQWYAPGELWAYCNSGFSLAGRVIEVVLDMPFAQAMRQRIFEPLGLERSSFFAHEAIVWPHAVGHNPVAPGSDEHIVAPQYYPANRFPAGGIISNAPDLLRFARFHMGDGTANGQRVMSETVLTAMQEPQREAGNWCDAWGIGWNIRWIDGVQVIAHDGTINGFKTQLTVVPEKRFAVAILTNSSRGDAAIRPIERWILEREAEVRFADPGCIDLPHATLERYAGRYRHPDTDIIVTVDDGGLLLAASGSWPGLEGRIEHPAERLVPVSEHEFVVADGEGEGERVDVILRDDGSVRFLRRHGRLYDRVQVLGENS